MTMPPRSLKSIAISVAFPAWLLGRDPRLRIMAVSYSEGLAEKLASDCLKVIDAPWYREAFPATRIARGRVARLHVETTRGGGWFSSSVGGSVTGRGGDIILHDDPHEPEEAGSDVRRQAVLDWYGSTLLSRLKASRHPHAAGQAVVRRALSGLRRLAAIFCQKLRTLACGAQRRCTSGKDRPTSERR